MKKVMAILLVATMASLAYGDAFFEDFSTYTLSNVGLPGSAPDGQGADNPGSWQALFGGGIYHVLITDPNNGIGFGGWRTSDVPGDAAEFIMVDGFGANPDPAKSGVYAHSGWISPYFAGGGLSDYNGVAHFIGSLNPGDEISWVQNIAHASSFMEMVVGTDLANGNPNDDVKFHIEMGGAAYNKTYYRVFDTGDTSFGTAEIVNDQPSLPFWNAGSMGSWTEVVVTMGVGLDINLTVRNLTRFDDPQNPNENIVGIGPWVDLGDFDTGALPSDDLWIAFRGQSGNASNWSRISTFDVLNITASPVSLMNHATVNESNETSDTIILQVNAIPASTTTINLVSTDPNEQDFTVSPQQVILNPITMDPNNLPQVSITVTAVDDVALEGDEIFQLQAVPDGDPAWTASNTADVTVIDDEGIRFTDDGMAAAEQGETSDSYTIELGISPASDDVIIDLATDNSQITLDKTLLTFTTGDWNIPQMVTATAVDDSDPEADPHTVDITHTVNSTDALFSGATAPNVTVSITDNDCDSAGPFLVGDISGPLGVSDCVIDLYDFAAMIAGWTNCSLPNVPGCITP